MERPNRSDSQKSEHGAEGSSNPGRAAPPHERRLIDGPDWQRDEAIFACDLCDSRFSSASLLYWHYHQCHTDQTKARREDTPQALASTSSDYRDCQTFPCVYCLHNFPSYQALIHHISTAHASVWYQSLATANRLDEYAYMRQLLQHDLAQSRSPLTAPFTSPIGSMTSPRTPVPQLPSPLLTPPIFSTPDIKPTITLSQSSNYGNRVLFSSSSTSSSENENSRFRLSTHIYKDSRVFSTKQHCTTPVSMATEQSISVSDHQDDHRSRPEAKAEANDSSAKDASRDNPYTRIVINGHEQFLCKFCDAVFASELSVSDHVTVTHCNVSSASPDDDTRSTNTNSEKPGDSDKGKSGCKYECHYCTDAFPLYTALQEHIRCYHGDEYYRRRGRKDATPPLTPVTKQPTPKQTPPDMPADMFNCKLCVSGFTQNSLLADHYQKIHGLPATQSLAAFIHESEREKSPVVKTERRTPLPVVLPIPVSLPVPPVAANSETSSSSVSTMEQSAARPRCLSEHELDCSDTSILSEQTQREVVGEPVATEGSATLGPSNESIELKYICEVCDARFPLYVSMQEHIRTAHGERPFECDVCRKQFTKRCYLLKHLQSHPNTHYDCLHCGRRFLSWTQRRDHMMQHEIEGVFLCTHCGSRFTLQRHLDQHLKTHVDASHLLVCVDCNKKFDDSLEFQEHVRSHVRCPYCSQVFDTNKNLVDHIETTHQKAKLQAKLQQEVQKKPQKSVAPVPKTKVSSPAKSRSETSTTMMGPVTSTQVSTVTTAPPSSSAISTTASNPFSSGMAPMYVWMAGSHFPAAVFPTFSIVGPQLTAMRALNESSTAEHAPSTLATRLAPPGNLLPGYQAYALPYPAYPGNILLPPAADGDDPAPAPAQMAYESQQTDWPVSTHRERSEPPAAAHEPQKRRRTPEIESVAKKPKTKPTPPSAYQSDAPEPNRSSLGPSLDSRQRYNCILGQLAAPNQTTVLPVREERLPVPAASTGPPMAKQHVCPVCAEILPTPELLARHQAEHDQDDSSLPLNLSTRSNQEPIIDVLRIKTETSDVGQNHFANVRSGSSRKKDVARTPLESEPGHAKGKSCGRDPAPQNSTAGVDTRFIRQCEITPVGSDFFRCEICMSIISNLHLVEKHLNEHFAMQSTDEHQITFTCGKCCLNFTQRSEFFYHLLKNHTDDNYYQCTICKKKFITERFLDKHMNVHLLRQNYACQFCSKGFYLADVCNRHERLHWQYGDKPKALVKPEAEDPGQYVDVTGLSGVPGVPAATTGPDLHPPAAPAVQERTEPRAPSPRGAPGAGADGNRQHVYAMYKCQSCQMEFSHKRQIKQHLKDSACALDDTTSTRNYTKFYKCRLCHCILDATVPSSVSQHLLIRHQVDVINVAASSPKSDDSSASNTTANSDPEFASKEYDWDPVNRTGGSEKHGLAHGEMDWTKASSRPFPQAEEAPVAPLDGDSARPSQELICPVCDLVFTSSQQLGEHRCKQSVDDSPLGEEPEKND